MENKKPNPITLEEAAENIDFLLDVAVNTRDLQYGSHLVLCELIKALNAAGIIDGRAIISNILAQLDAIPEANYRIGAQTVCADLLLRLPASPPATGEPLH